jgi:hypothetical protein
MIALAECIVTASIDFVVVVINMGSLSLFFAENKCIIMPRGSLMCFRKNCVDGKSIGNLCTEGNGNFSSIQKCKISNVISTFKISVIYF